MITKQEALKLSRFLEEFSWLMETYSKVDLKKASSLINEFSEAPSTSKNIVGDYKIKNPNINSLTGILPTLLLDSSLFKTNEDIAGFSAAVLKLEIPRFDKKSKHEIIGLIVCKTTELNEKELDNLVKDVSLLANSEKNKKILVKKKKEGTFSWNDVIQHLIKE